LAKRNSAMESLKPVLQVLVNSKDLGMVFFVMAILSIIIVPLPSGLLDFMLTISISIAVLIL